MLFRLPDDIGVVDRKRVVGLKRIAIGDGNDDIHRFFFEVLRDIPRDFAFGRNGHFLGPACDFKFELLAIGFHFDLIRVRLTGRADSIGR